jgi:predicted O-methyltransferase YrrM
MSPELETLIRTEVPSLDGWTTVERCLELAGHVIEEKPGIFVDIGCYGGRIAIPAAMAMRENGGGCVVTIDTWHGDDSAEGECPESAKWWKECPLEEIHQHFMSALRRLDLIQWCLPLCCPSQFAFHAFGGPISMVSIDGCHTETASLRDAQLYVPKVKPGGIIFADDLDWAIEGVNSTAKMREYIDSRAERIGGDSHYGIWRKK